MLTDDDVLRIVAETLPADLEDVDELDEQLEERIDEGSVDALAEMELREEL